MYVFFSLLLFFLFFEGGRKGCLFHKMNGKNDDDDDDEDVANGLFRGHVGPESEEMLWRGQEDQRLWVGVPLYAADAQGAEAGLAAVTRSVGMAE